MLIYNKAHIVVEQALMRWMLQMRLEQTFEVVSANVMITQNCPATSSIGTDQPQKRSICQT